MEKWNATPTLVKDLKTVVEGGMGAIPEASFYDTMQVKYPQHLEKCTTNTGTYFVYQPLETDLPFHPNDAIKYDLLPDFP